MPVLPIIGIAAAVAGTAISAVGQAKAGSAAQSAANYNASLDVQNAQKTLESGKIAEQQQRYADRAVIARGIADAGASGVDVNSGSPMDVMTENTRQAEINALTVRRNYRLQAQAELQGAQSQVMQGQNAKAASDFGVASTLLTGGAKVASGIIGLKNTTVPKKVPIPNQAGSGDLSTNVG